MPALLAAYFDDSQIDRRLWIVAGFAGYANQWEFFERLWAGVLAIHGVPYFHMREMANRNGAFAKWHPPEQHEAEVTAYLGDAVRAIRDPYLQMFGAVVHIADLERFNAENGTRLDPYALAASACLSQLGASFPNQPVTATFDRVENIDDRLVTARDYAESGVGADTARRVAAVALESGLTSRSVAPLQAADLAVWEGRRAFLSAEPSQATPAQRPQKTRDQQWEEFRVWSRMNQGREYPLQRKSLEALIDHGMPLNLVVWDHHRLSQAHEARGGIWSRTP